MKGKTKTKFNETHFLEEWVELTEDIDKGKYPSLARYVLESYEEKAEDFTYGSFDTGKKRVLLNYLKLYPLLREPMGKAWLEEYLHVHHSTKSLPPGDFRAVLDHLQRVSISIALNMGKEILSLASGVPELEAVVKQTLAHYGKRNIAEIAGDDIFQMQILTLHLWHLPTLLKGKPDELLRKGQWETQFFKNIFLKFKYDHSLRWYD